MMKQCVVLFLFLTVRSPQTLKYILCKLVMQALTPNPEQRWTAQDKSLCDTVSIPVRRKCHLLLLLSCAKSTAALSASCKRSRPPSNLVNGQELTMWHCLDFSSHIVRCQWNPISCGTYYTGPALSENDSAVTTDVGEDLNREVGLWGLPVKWNWPP